MRYEWFYAPATTVLSWTEDDKIGEYRPDPGDCAVEVKADEGAVFTGSPDEVEEFGRRFNAACKAAAARQRARGES